MGWGDWVILVWRIDGSYDRMWGEHKDFLQCRGSGGDAFRMGKY